MRSQKTTFGVALTATALLLTACSPSDTAAEAGDGGQNNDGLYQITIGIMEIAPAAPIVYGVEQGIFEEHGLDVQYDISRGGPVMLPAVDTGEYDFGIVNPLTVLNANDSGLDMTILTGFANGPTDREDVQGVVTRTDSGIEDFADLSNKEVAVNTLYSQGDLTILEANEQQGGTPEDINLMEIPFPDMAAQLDAGNTDAIWLPEPLLSQALSDPNNTLIGSAAQEVLPGLPMLVSFTSQSYIEEHPEIVDKFESAIEESVTESAENEEAVRDLLPDFLGFPPEVTQNMGLEDWDSTLNKELIDETGELAIKHDFISSVEEDLYRD